MGLRHIRAKLTRPSGRAITVRFMVDSGALYSVLPEDVWRTLRLRPGRTAEFVLADGTALRRGVSECCFEIAGQAATSPVVLGQGDERRRGLEC